MINTNTFFDFTDFQPPMPHCSIARPVPHPHVRAPCPSHQSVRGRHVALRVPSCGAAAVCVARGGQLAPQVLPTHCQQRPLTKQWRWRVGGRVQTTPPQRTSAPARTLAARPEQTSQPSLVVGSQCRPLWVWCGDIGALAVRERVVYPLHLLLLARYLRLNIRYVKSVFMIHVGGTRCVTSSTDHIMKIHFRITLTVEFIRGYIFKFLFYVSIQGRV